MTLTVIVGLIVSLFFIWAGFSRRLFRMRHTTRRIAVIIGFSVLLITVAIALDNIFQWWQHFPKGVIGVIGVLIVLDRVVRIGFGRKRGGAKVLDIGRIAGLDVGINVFTGVVLAWFSLRDLVTVLRLPFWTFDIISLPILGLSLAFAVLVQGLNKRALLERGIFLGTGFLSWEKIKGYTWEKESAASSVLVLRKRTKVPLLNITTLSVKSEQVRAVEEILHQHQIGQISDE
jgi:hypothetical protein